MAGQLVLDMDVITSVLLADGWHPVQAGTMFATNNPQLRDPGDPAGPALTPGGLWIWFTGQDGIAYGFPSAAIGAVRWTGVISAPPAVSAVSPATGPEGTAVTVTGAGFTAATGVMFGTVPAASFSIGSDASLTAVSPAGLAGQTADILVTGPAGTSAVTPADQFTGT